MEMKKCSNKKLERYTIEEGKKMPSKEGTLEKVNTKCYLPVYTPSNHKNILLLPQTSQSSQKFQPPDVGRWKILWNSNHEFSQQLP